MKNIKSKLVKCLATAILSASPMLITNCKKKDSVRDYVIPGLECEFYEVYDLDDLLDKSKKKPIAEEAKCQDNQYDNITLTLIKYQKENSAKEDFESEYEGRIEGEKRWRSKWGSPPWIKAHDIQTCDLGDQCFIQRRIEIHYRSYIFDYFIRYKNFMVHIELEHVENSNYTYFNLETQRAWSLAKQQIEIITQKSK